MDTNSLYILDEDLNVTGEIRDLAPDERVYSARLMGDTGYFVTFRETDPLFSWISQTRITRRSSGN